MLCAPEIARGDVSACPRRVGTRDAAIVLAALILLIPVLVYSVREHDRMLGAGNRRAQTHKADLAKAAWAYNTLQAGMCAEEIRGLGISPPEAAGEGPPPGTYEAVVLEEPLARLADVKKWWAFRLGTHAVRGTVRGETGISEGVVGFDGGGCIVVKRELHRDPNTGPKYPARPPGSGDGK
jgi:hypothetical protein